jgi:ferredoxin hydrogenase large subunit/hydrogenase large subunit
MFRGFESILRERDPLDAVQITQRICGVCPVSHGIASSMALEDAMRVQVPENGRLLRNLILGANYIQSDIVHFYQLSALDFIDITAILSYKGGDPKLTALRDWVISEQNSNALGPAAPFLPRYNGDYITDPEINILAIQHYLQALQMRALAHEMAAVFGGKIPHVPALVVGGVTSNPAVNMIEAFRSRLLELQMFIDSVYVPDVMTVGGAFPQFFQIGTGPRNLLSYGNFPEDSGGTEKFLSAGVILQGKAGQLDLSILREDVAYSWFSSRSGLHPSKGANTPAPGKSNAYSWVKAPRYGDAVMEVGPLARVLITHANGKNARLSELLTQTLNTLHLTTDDLFSTMGRHLARAVECKLIAEKMNGWLDQLEPGKPAVASPGAIPESGSGVGLMEAPRGALGHWVDIGRKTIQHYECVVPTTWNCSPRDDRGQPGAVEQALEGVAVADAAHPIEALRVVHSFDPCLACAVH